MSAKTNGQVFVDNEEQLSQFFSDANFIDCRINGYPLYDDDYERKWLSPSFIFIDFDLSLCSTCKYPIRKLDYILKQTLRKSKKRLMAIQQFFGLVVDIIFISQSKLPTRMEKNNR